MCMYASIRFHKILDKINNVKLSINLGQCRVGSMQRFIRFGQKKALIGTFKWDGFGVKTIISY